MGIKDLLRFMKPYTEPIHIHNYTGTRVGIDAYSWLHKGAYSCSMELSLNSEGDKKYQYINYFMHRINLLRYHKITPVVVFDGGNIPCKAGTENERYRRRKANKEMAMEKLREGNVGAATELFQRAISITPSMAHELIQALLSENVEFVVAPYEADAQLAYLSSLGEEEGGIVAVISEDSDLLAYGCPAVIFKMDRFGNGEEIVLDKVFKSSISKPSFRNFNKDLFIQMCVLAGCDFLPSIPGIGIAKAHSLVSKYRNIDRVLSVLKFEKAKQMPDDYLRSFKEAVTVFQHARIYDRLTKRLAHMKPLPVKVFEELGGELDFLGPDLPSTIATAIAEGKLDPSTMEAYECSLSDRSQKHLAVTQTSEHPEIDGSMSGVDTTRKHQSFKDRKRALAKSVPPALEAHREEDNAKESCFTVYSSRKIIEEHVPNEVIMVPRQVLEERNFSDEAAALAKLASSSVEVLVHNNEEENSVVSSDLPLRTPENNPFKKRKLLQSVKNTETTPTTPESRVTEIEQQLETKWQTLGSQESVNSKLKSVDANKENKGMKKSKMSNCKNSENRKSGILNFFSRI